MQFALKGRNAAMPVIVRTADKPYRWKIGGAPLDKVANREKKLPPASSGEMVAASPARRVPASNR